MSAKIKPNQNNLPDPFPEENESIESLMQELEIGEGINLSRKSILNQNGRYKIF